MCLREETATHGTTVSSTPVAKALAVKEHGTHERQLRRQKITTTSAGCSKNKDLGTDGEGSFCRLPLQYYCIETANATTTTQPTTTAATRQQHETRSSVSLAQPGSAGEVVLQPVPPHEREGQQTTSCAPMKTGVFLGGGLGSGLGVSRRDPEQQQDQNDKRFETFKGKNRTRSPLRRRAT